MYFLIAAQLSDRAGLGWASCVELVRSGSATGPALHHSYSGLGFQHPYTGQVSILATVEETKLSSNNQEAPWVGGVGCGVWRRGGTKGVVPLPLVDKGQPMSQQCS